METITQPTEGRARADGKNASRKENDDGNNDARHPEQSQSDTESVHLNGLAIWYDDGEHFWGLDARGDYCRIPDREVKRRLIKTYGIAITEKPENGDGPLSQLDQILSALTRDHHVCWVGSLAGYHAGVHFVNGRHILVKDSPIIVEPKTGDCSTILTFMGNLFGDQVNDMHAILKLKYEALRKGEVIPSPVTALVGPVQCGKTFFINNIMTPILGGRRGDPFQFMQGGTAFNSDVTGAEHVVVDDEVSPTDHKGRLRLGMLIKRHVAAEVHRCHSKGRDAISLPGETHLTIACNDQLEDLAILPPLTAEIRDKLSIFKACEPESPLPARGTAANGQWKKQIEDQLGAYAQSLLDFKVPAEIATGGRFGIRTWQDPQILALLGGLSPELEFLELARIAIRSLGDPNVFFAMEWTSSSVLKCIWETEFLRDALRHLKVSSPVQCGHMLNKLCRLHPGDVNSRILKGVVQYRMRSK